MPEFSINEDGSITQYSKYTVLHVPNLSFIYPRDVERAANMVKGVEGVTGKLVSYYHSWDKTNLMRAMFYKFFIKVLERVANGDVFIFPGKSNTSI